LSANLLAGSINITLLNINSVGSHETILALACKSAAKSGIAMLTEAIPRGPIMEPRQTIINANLATAKFSVEVSDKAGKSPYY
jgi:hypothetical protein